MGIVLQDLKIFDVGENGLFIDRAAEFYEIALRMS
jgi:hypothetical protein